MTPDQIKSAAAALRQAAETGQAIGALRNDYPDMTIESAYAVQQINTEHQLQQGRRRIGCKIGLTSPAVQKQLGVDQPDFGMLFDNMGYGDGEPIPFSALMQPKVEAEIAFVLKSDLDMPNPTQVDVMQAIDYALPAIEIVGSRIANWDIRITDTIADNASSSTYVLGTSPRKLSEFDIRLCGMAMMKGGDPVSVGAGAACLGNPVNAVVWLARTLVSLGTPLNKGDLVLSGALGPMAPVAPGENFEARINGLGNVRAVFEPDTTTKENK